MKNFFTKSKKSINILKIKNIFCIFFLFCLLFVNIDYTYSQTNEPCPAPGYVDPLGNSAGTTVDPNCLTDITTVSAPAPVVKNVDCGKKDNYDCYTLLESIGGGGESGVTEQVIIRNGELSGYLQQIITYLLMLVAVAAVFYMIYGGILYVTTDIINKKAEGKEMIQRVTYGLIFVFTVWLLINSINPNMLKNSLDFSLSTIGIDLASTTPSQTTQTPATPTIKPIVMGSCATGLETVQGSYQLCKDVADKMKELLAAASAAGVNLQIVSAYRSADSSTVSGGGTAAASGMSNHQRGRAVDFSGFKNGPDKEGRFMWLQNNASKYGFYNILYKTKSDEYNHWSTTGK
jgi:hypothetical protein